jgi:RNA polymerase-associated protein CTR9
MSDSQAGKTIEIDLVNEVVTIELDDLEADASNIILLLQDSDCKVWVWTKLAGEYWRRGYPDEAEKIALAAIESA